MRSRVITGGRESRTAAVVLYEVRCEDERVFGGRVRSVGEGSMGAIDEADEAAEEARRR